MTNARRWKAQPMAETTANPLDDALESIQRDDLGGSATAGGDNGGDAFAPPPPPPPETEQPKKPGRPRNPNSRRSRSGKYGGAAAPPPPASGPVNDPPLPAQRVEYPKIDPASVSQSIQQIDALLVKAFGTTPISPDEAKGGGAVFAPVLDHYMPLLADKGGLWIAPLTWVILTYGPRAYEVLDAKQKAEAARRNGWTQPAGAQSGDNGKRTFQPAGDETARPFSVDQK